MLRAINHTLKSCLLTVAFFCAAVVLSGCKEPRMSSSAQVEAFELAGPITPQVDMDQIFKVKTDQGVYAVGAGDVLELQMPTILTAISPKLYKSQLPPVQPYLCRVSDAGTITLPIIGQMQVEGKTLAQIENKIAGAYYPKYIVSQPSVVCNVKEYFSKNVTIVGAVMQPGVYKLQSNEMTLVNALMKAGGIIEDGASVITIKNPKRKYTAPSQTTKSTDEVKQMAELDSGVNTEYIEYIDSPKEEVKSAPENETDFSALQVDLVFRPDDSSPTEGTLLIQRGSKILYTKRINIKDLAERAEYTKELQSVIGSEQAYIVGQAIEQLAAQFSSSNITTAENGELFNATNDLSQNSEADCPGCDKKNTNDKRDGEVEFVTIDNAVSSQNVNIANDINHVEPALKPRYSTSPAAETVDGIVLPVKGLNIPFADVPLMEGDLIEVKRFNPAVFTVIGLAKAPGAFPYPPDTEYNLMQAIGFAGGVDLIADPRFVTVYRQDAKGDIVSAVFRIDKEFMAKSCEVKIKPGDVISIDVTPRTKRNVLLHQVLRINFGVFVNPFGDLND